MKRFLLASSVWLLANGISFAQKLFTLEIKSDTTNEFLRKLSYKKTFSGKQEREKEIQNVIFILNDEAY
ncbi:MAG TPA: hypothetical protein VII99_17985, partial [Bacteroidia bacterium]